LNPEKVCVDESVITPVNAEPFPV
jgi:hypothetical protein